MHPAFLGIDIAKRSFCVALRQGEKVEKRRFENTPAGHQDLLRWVAGRIAAAARGGAAPTAPAPAAPTPVQAGLEATGRYGLLLARALHAAGHRVSVINPCKIARYAESKLRRAKTDPADAVLIAEYVAKEAPAPWTPPAAEREELQARVRRLTQLQALRQQERNRQEAEAGGSAWVRADLEAHLKMLDGQIAAAQAAIQAHMEAHASLRAERDQLCSIPGLGETTAAALLAELGDWRQFRGARQVAAFAGLAPHLQQSGERRKRSTLYRRGNEALRKCLFYPTLCALRFNGVVREFGERLAARGKPRMVVVAAAMRKLLQLAYGVLKSGQNFNSSGEPRAESVPT